MEKMEHALAGDDAHALRLAAHSLKGLAANFDAAPTVAAAQQLETLAGSGELATAPDVLDDLRQRVDELNQALANEDGGSG